MPTSSCPTAIPLEILTYVTRMAIEGRDDGLDNKQLALYQKYMARQLGETECR